MLHLFDLLYHRSSLIQLLYTSIFIASNLQFRNFLGATLWVIVQMIVPLRRLCPIYPSACQGCFQSSTLFNQFSLLSQLMDGYLISFASIPLTFSFHYLFLSYI